MRSIRALLVVACLLVPLPFLLATSGHAQGIPQNIPRKELLILENPEGTVKNAGWFNIWAINAGLAVERTAAGGARHALVHRSRKRSRRRLG